MCRHLFTVRDALKGSVYQLSFLNVTFTDTLHTSSTNLGGQYILSAPPNYIDCFRIIQLCLNYYKLNVDEPAARGMSAVYNNLFHVILGVS